MLDTAREEVRLRTHADRGAASGQRAESQWLTIRRIKPDWVILRGWGVMNPVALKTAQKVGFPADHIIGNIWSNSEEDVRPAGDAAKGFISITTHPSGTQLSGAAGDRSSMSIEAGKGNLEDPKRIGTRVLQPGRRERHPQRRGAARRAGEVRQQAAHGRRGALGLRTPESRRRAPEAAWRAWARCSRSSSPAPITKAAAPCASSNGTVRTGR